MPVNRKYPLPMLMQTCKEYFAKTGRRISIEYVMIKDMNVSKQDANRLLSLTEGFLSHINLIPVNYVEERGFHPPSEGEIKEFCELLLYVLLLTSCPFHIWRAGAIPSSDDHTAP